MSDTQDQDPVDPGLPQRLAAVWQAAVDLDKGSFRAGFDAGWSAGWDAGIRMILERLPKAPPPPEPVKEEATTATVPLQPALAAGLRPTEISVASRVYRIIRRTPGLRGIEILKLLRDDEPDLLERTMRTGLYRQKKAKRIKVVDGRWYTTEAAPADPQPTLPEG